MLNFLLIFLNSLISSEVDFEKKLLSNNLTTNNYEILNSITSRLFWIAENPLKIAILIVTLITKIKSKFNALEAEWSMINQMYIQLISTIIDNTKDFEDIKTLFYDHWYNKCQVIDLIAQNNMWSILQNAKVDLILEDIWLGPYEYNILLTQYSVMSAIVSPYLLGKMRFFSHVPFQNEAVPRLTVRSSDLIL